MRPSRFVVALMLAATFAATPAVAQRPSPEGGQPQQKEEREAADSDGRGARDS